MIDEDGNEVDTEGWEAEAERRYDAYKDTIAEAKFNEEEKLKFEYPFLLERVEKQEESLNTLAFELRKAKRKILELEVRLHNWITNEGEGSD